MGDSLPEVYFEKRFDFKEFSVIVRPHNLTYESNLNGELVQYCIPTHFNITIDKEEDGGKIEINYKDQWGSSMQFIHYFPSDAKGMFSFIARGYNLEFY
jgi:hypothetical protein